MDSFDGWDTPVGSEVELIHHGCESSAVNYSTEIRYGVGLPISAVSCNTLRKDERVPCMGKVDNDWADEYAP